MNAEITREIAHVEGVSELADLMRSRHRAGARCFQHTAQSVRYASSTEKLMAVAIKPEFDSTDLRRRGHFQQMASVGVRSRKWPRLR